MRTLNTSLRKYHKVSDLALESLNNRREPKGSDHSFLETRSHKSLCCCIAEFVDQICPKPNTNDRKYVRIKTYNGKYVYAYAYHKYDTSYVRTRCCGGKDAVGRKDVKVPSRRTTFRVHCKRIGNTNTVMFEILNNKNNNPSGYYIYANPAYLRYALRVYKPEWDKRPTFNFVIKRWRGPVVAIRTYGAGSNWWSFGETSNTDGYVRAYKNPVYSTNSFPNIDKTFTLEAGMVWDN